MSADWIKPKGIHFFDLPDCTAVFFICPEKTFLIQAECGLGERLQRARRNERFSRPQTFELLADVCTAFGAKVAGVALTDVRDDVFYSRISLEAKNELGEKFVEIDARPSDSLVLAFSTRAPILVAKKVLDACRDARELFEKLRSIGPGLKA